MDDEVRIRRGIPLPKRPRLTKWGKVADEMKTGDMAEVKTRNQAISLKNALSRFGKEGRMAVLGKDRYGVWVMGEGEL